MTYRGKTLTIGLAVAALALAAVAAPAQAQTSDSMPSFNGTVLTIAYAGKVAYLGGDFTAAIVRGKQVTRSHLAAVDARTGALLPWAPAADGRVKALVVSGGSVFLAGDFGTIGGQKRDSLARVDAARGVVYSTFKHAINGRPYAIALAGNRLYLGGAITAVDGQARARLAAFNLTTGALDPTWRPTADDQVETIATGAGRVYVGGKFHKINGLSGYDRLVALDPRSAAVVNGFKPQPPVITYALAVDADGVYSAHGGHGGRVSAYTPGGQLRWSATFDGDAQAITVLDGVVYAGGHFDRACSTARTGTQGTCVDGADNRVKLAALAAADGRLLDWTADANGVEGVFALASNSELGSVAMGGAFTAVDGRLQKRFAQFS
ncbi:outer membrane protein assembly factor BamB family protein [Paractinoplanes durhamensis]|uniref:outer membrane protein assembly factor BamB family protein n=1 Tax=Paractinoplanes durhamensis TaxID=113563 RepID=UPI001EF32A90|nr:PQQ-binding-like beta-propeller repeat protein [Actinoplanes durhamensis]